MFNDIDGDFDEIAIRTFKVGLPTEHGLRKSLTGKPVTSLQGKGKLRLSLKKEMISGRTDTVATGREGIMQINQGQITLRLSVQSSESRCIKYKIKNEPFFKRPNKMVRNPEN